MPTPQRSSRIGVTASNLSAAFSATFAPCPALTGTRAGTKSRFGAGGVSEQPPWHPGVRVLLTPFRICEYESHTMGAVRCNTASRLPHRSHRRSRLHPRFCYASNCYSRLTPTAARSYFCPTFAALQAKADFRKRSRCAGLSVVEFMWYCDVAVIPR